MYLSCHSCKYNTVDNSNFVGHSRQKRTGLWLRQLENTYGYLWNKFDNVQPNRHCLELLFKWHPCNQLHAIKEVITWKASSGVKYKLGRYTLHILSNAGTLQHINGNFTIRKLKSSVLSYNLVQNRPSLSISRRMPRKEADLIVSVL